MYPNSDTENIYFGISESKFLLLQNLDIIMRTKLSGQLKISKKKTKLLLSQKQIG